MSPAIEARNATIRKRYADDKTLTPQILAKEFGVTVGCMYRILGPIPRDRQQQRGSSWRQKMNGEVKEAIIRRDK